MLKFPISFSVENGSYEWILYGEWTIQCFLKEVRHQGINLFILKIQRKHIFEETVIFGALSLTRPVSHTASCSVSKLGPERKFAGVMREGSSSLDINFEYQFAEVFSSGINYSLEGDMNIISISEICVSAFGNKDYIKGDNLKSLEQLSNDFEILLNTQTSFLSDVNLICGGASIPLK
ncbi:hypothetical protein AVEN_215622-1 [Araneus ventricosus]|uniref:Uncharacterized protein n=1 Tax=Araneus ventricosus TaxID=182803 RepID=A0A4Y2KHZ8_ARAVE|nr:hypothetical protein AVEN_98593-1 [Araneus ventricosus]GBN01602.1 hypothetical protein AVEN_215622-1 [Araneus ventricosus]